VKDECEPSTPAVSRVGGMGGVGVKEEYIE
jgi:hypothetical protein